jgi:hypothetical protein
MGSGRRLAALLAAAALSLGACGGGEEAGPGTSPPPTPTGEASAAELTLQMKARNNSGQDGTAILSATPDGNTTVVLDLANSPAGPQPSHVSSGTCANLGSTVHILGGLRGGKLQATVPASLDSLLSGQFAVNVTKSPREFGVSVSCAEIRRPA